MQISAVVLVLALILSGCGQLGTNTAPSPAPTQTYTTPLTPAPPPPPPPPPPSITVAIDTGKVFATPLAEGRFRYKIEAASPIDIAFVPKVVIDQITIDQLSQFRPCYFENVFSMTVSCPWNTELVLIIRDRRGPTAAAAAILGLVGRSARGINNYSAPNKVKITKLN